MNTNSNLGSATLQIIKAAGDEGINFPGIVRELRRKGFDPGMDEVRGELHELYNATGKLWIGDGLRVHFGPLDAEYSPEDTPFAVQVVPTESVGDYFTGDGVPYTMSYAEAVDAEGMLGFFSSADEAYRAAITDVFGLEGARMVWEDDTEAEEWALRYMQSVTIPPVMPPYEMACAVPTAEQQLQAEIDAITQALRNSIDEDRYIRLKDETEDDVLKLTFAVEVDFDAMKVTAEMSGSIKLTCKSTVSIPDARQMELDFGKEGADD